MVSQTMAADELTSLDALPGAPFAMKEMSWSWYTEFTTERGDRRVAET